MKHDLSITGRKTHTASSLRVGLDAASIGAVHDLGVLEGHTVHGVVALTTNGSDAQTVATRAVDVVNGDLGSTSDSNTIILVVNGDVLQSDIVTGRDIEAVTVVSSSIVTASAVRLIASRVVQSQTRNGEVLDTIDVEAVNRPVLDVESGDLGVIDMLHYNEVVWPGILC